MRPINLFFPSFASSASTAAIKTLHRRRASSTRNDDGVATLGYLVVGRNDCE